MDDKPFSAKTASGMGISPGNSKSGSPATSLSEPLERGKAAIGSAMHEASESAAADVEALKEDFRHLKATVAKLLSETRTETVKTVRDASSVLAHKGSDLAATATEQARSVLTQVEDTARRNPIAALAGAALIGFLLGLRRR